MRGMSAVARNPAPDPIVFEITEDGGAFGLSEPGWYSYLPSTGESRGPFPTSDEAEKAN